jgi:hypothetical protein
MLPQKLRQQSDYWPKQFKSSFLMGRTPIKIIAL